MTSTATTVRPRRTPRPSLEWIAPAILVIAALVLMVNLSRSLPARETLKVRNPTGATVTVRVSGDGRSWLAAGTVDAESTEKLQELTDQGDDWRFALSVGPTTIGEIRRTKAQLEAAGWQLTIPTSAADKLPLDRRVP